MSRAVFLDRDGVVNAAIVRAGKPHAPASLAELQVPPEVAPALLALHARGFLLIVVTNQPQVARGTLSRGTVEEMHRQLSARLPLDAILTCYHDDADGCACRKPQPGLLLEAARTHGIDLKASYLIGDRWRDIEAGARAGCTTLFIDHRYAEEPPRSHDHCVASLREARDIILAGAA